MRTRSLHLAMVVALLGSLFSVVLGGTRATAAPNGAISETRLLAQDVDGIYPPSVSVQGERFLFDRLVPLDRETLERVEDIDDLAFYARTDAPPFEALYGLRSGRSTAGLARYLPSNVAAPDTQCRAEAAQVGPLTGGEATYAFAGIETDLTTDNLEQIADAGGQPVYADPGVDQPAAELFLAGDEGLLRFLITDQSSLPTALPADIPFGEAVYAFESDATDQVDPSVLVKVGCVGPFPAFTQDQQVGTAADRLFVLVAGRYLDFPATGAAPDDTDPIPADQSDDDADDATPDIEGEDDGDDAPPATPGTDGEEPAITGTDDATDDDADDQADDGGDDGSDSEDGESEITRTDDDSEATPGTDTESDTDTEDDETGSVGLTLELTENLGSGGQPDDLPREIVVDGSRYLFDRTLPLSQDDLILVAEADAVLAYAQTDAGPFDAVFLTAQSGEEGELARYLPERLDAPEVDCSAQALSVGVLTTGDASYAFAGVETTLTDDTLEQIGDSDGQAVYADPGAEQPSPELFVTDPSGLLRFVLLGGDGRPAVISDTLAFSGAEFDLVGDVSGQVDVTTLAKAGCAGPFPVYTDPAQAGGDFLDLYVVVGDSVFQFGGGTAPVEDATPDEPADTPEPATETPVPDTETPVPDTETPVPDTETPVPDTETPVPDTETPVPDTETPVPDTETPVPDTETPVPDTETPVPDTETTVPDTETPVPPTDTVAAVDEPTEAPAEEPTEAPVEEPTEAAATTPTDAQIPLTAEDANLPAQVEIQNTTYIFNQVSVDIDIQTLVQVEFIVVQNVELTVYARETVVGVAPELYCVTTDGQVVGQYVPAASAQPTPPPSLPATVEVENATYVFNEVDIDIDIQTLVQIEVIVIQNVEVTIYADQSVQGQPTRLFAVTPGGEVVGQYVESTLVVTLQAQPTAQPTIEFQPPAVVPTLAPNVPSPAAVTAVPSLGCSGDIGEADARGVPSYLPNRVQLGGVAYKFVRGEDVDEVGTLTRITCVGPFEAVSTDQADRSAVIYLRSERAGGQVFRFEAALTFRVDIEVTGQTRTVDAGDRNYQLLQTWQPAIYASLSVILFAEDLENQAPDTFYAVDVHDSVVGELIAEYRRADDDSEQPTDEIVAAVEGTDFNLDLFVNTQRYILVAIFYPVGTTTNGFLTLFSVDPEGESDILLGRDKRRLELFIFHGSEPVGG